MNTGTDRITVDLTIEITCAIVQREVSNYMEADITRELRDRIEQHIMACQGCKAVYDGVRNIITLVNGNDVIELPVGFSRRLREKLSLA